LDPESGVVNNSGLRQIDAVKKNAAMMDPRVLLAYDRWVAEHLDEMSRKYPHKFIAVYGGKLVAVGDSYREVFAAARAQGIAERPFAMQVPTAEDLDVVL
jgi:hypothetical protein